MQYYGLQETAYRLHVSEKTLRRWIKQAKLEHKIDHGKYLIPENAVEAILARKETKGDKLLTDRIEALESRINALSKWVQEQKHLLDRIERMEIVMAQFSSRLSTIEDLLQQKTTPLPAPAPATSTLRPRHIPYASKSTARSTVPDGMIDLMEFSYNMHNVAPTTAKLAVKDGRLPAHHGEWKARGARVTMALDQEGQRRFIELFETNAGFKPCCPSCPAIHG
jgi:hypothetical protein